MRRTRLYGKTRVNPVNPNVKIGRNMKKKVGRLMRKVERLCRAPGAPLMAFISVSAAGLIEVSGSPKLLDELKSSAGGGLLQVVKPAVQTTSNPVSDVVDLKCIDVSGIEWDTINALKCRMAYAQILCTKGRGERGSYDPQRKPEYWPEGIPFCSHSAKRDDGKGRLLSGTDIRTVLKAFSADCLQKIARGVTPINYISNTSPEELLKQAMGFVGQVDMETQEDDFEPPMEEDQPCKKMKVEHTYSTSSKANENEGDDDHLESFLSQRNFAGTLNWLYDNFTNVGADSMSKLEKMLADEAPLQSDCQPCSQSMKCYRGPRDMLPGKGHRDLWEVVHELPDVARLRVFHHALSHIKHYVSQYEDLNTTVDDVKKALNNTSHENSIEGVLLDEAKSILITQMRGPSVFLFLAGAIASQLNVVECGKTTVSYPPCACTMNIDSVQSIFIDRRENHYAITEKSMWRGRATSMTRGTNDVQKVRRFAQLPGANGLLLTCYGHDVWRGEVERIERKQWLDDSIVNVMLRHAKATSGARNVHVLDTTFGKALLVPHSHAASREELPLTAINNQAADRFLHNLTLENYRLVLVPICNNVHWFLCALFPMRKIMAVICSLGNKYDDAATGLKTYFSLKLGQDFAVSYPKVPRQNNSRDCGVFIIEFGEDLIKNEDGLPDWEKLGYGGSRTRLIKMLASI